MSHASNMARHARRGAKEVRSAARHVRRTAAAERNGVMHTVQRVGNEAVSAVKEGYEGLRDSAVEYIDEGRDKVQSLERSVENQIKMHPLTAVMIASGIGFVFGFFCSRR